MEQLRATPRRTEFQISRETADKVYATNEERASLRAITIGADRRLSYQFEYSSKWTWQAKLMRRFHAALLKDPERVGKLKENFESLQELFAVQVDFSAYDPSNFFHSLRMQTTQAGEPRSIDEMGTGQEQLLAIAFGYAYAKAFAASQDRLLLIIEEPEAHLHPVAQEWLASQVLRFASSDLQVLITTHSPYFVSLERLAGAVRVFRQAGTGPTEVVQRSPRWLADHCEALGAPKVSDPESMLTFYEANATNEMRAGLLSAGVVLVEGETEELSLPVLLGRFAPDVYRRGWKVVRCGSKSAMPKWIRLCEAYRKPFYAIFDSDGRDENHEGNSDLLAALGLGPAELAPLIAEHGVHAGDRFAVMGTTYETAMRHEFDNYSAHEEEARTGGGLRSKPTVARYVAARSHCATGSAVHRIAEALRVIMPASSSLPASDIVGSDSDPRHPAQGT